jgi:hypothetical protein
MRVVIVMDFYLHVARITPFGLFQFRIIFCNYESSYFS